MSVSLLKVLPIIVGQAFGRQRLQRTPEPRAVMAIENSVEQFNQAMTSKLAIAYAAALEVIYRARGNHQRSAAIDLGCGPGHFTILLAKHLGYERVVGVDLSAPMLDVARRNAERAGLADRVAFELGDVLDLDGIPDDSFDLATFTDAAHHLPNLDMVQSALTEMDRITAPSGMTLVMDLVRLKTEYLTARYLQAIGGEYLTRGLDQFFADFRDSMHAAWTPEELFSAVPKEPRRTWCHFAQSLLPTIQFAVGLPLGQLELFNRRGVPWSDADCPIPAKMRGDWRLLRATTLGLGRRKFFQPSASYSSLVCETLST